MMSYIFGGLIAVSVLCGLVSGRIEQVSAAAMSEAGNAVTLMIKLMGMMCLWSGLMKVADQAGLTQKLSALFSPLTKRLFRGLPADSPALKAITMNLSANLLGLGNAATPLGLLAMRELDREAGGGKTATNHMITFVVLNTASLQLIPTTTVLLRLTYGSASPMDILPAAWLSSAVSVVCGVAASRFYGKFFSSPTPTPAQTNAKVPAADPEKGRHWHLGKRKGEKAWNS